MDPVSSSSVRSPEQSSVNSYFAQHIMKATDAEILVLAAQNLPEIAKGKPLYFGSSGDIIVEESTLQRSSMGFLANNRNLENLTVFMDKLCMVLSKTNYDIGGIQELLGPAQAGLKELKSYYENKYDPGKSLLSSSFLLPSGESATGKKEPRVQAVNKALQSIDAIIEGTYSSVTKPSSNGSEKLLTHSILLQSILKDNSSTPADSDKLYTTRRAVSTQLENTLGTHIAKVGKEIETVKEKIAAQEILVSQNKDDGQVKNQQLTILGGLTNELEGLEAKQKDLLTLKGAQHETTKTFEKSKLSVAFFSACTPKGLEELEAKNKTLMSVFNGKGISEAQFKKDFSKEYFKELKSHIKAAENLLKTTDSDSAAYSEIKSFYLSIGKLFSLIGMIVNKHPD